ncbi:nucleotidyltransferase domain-containing protein [Candidatus Woesearchaeota archaeon]|nr:nucleotidyltransferase domain-containing protein [Candidatus Woesearchaeota archaeon]
MIQKLKKTKPADLNEAYQKAMAWFFSHPDREMSLNDLAEQLRISKTTAKRVVGELAGEGFLTKEVLGRIWRIKCNQRHPYNFTKKVSYNLSLIYESGILEAIHKKIENPRAIILFGSYRKGDDNEESDVDIAVEVLDNEEVRIAELGIIPVLGYRKNVPVNLYIFSRNKIDLNLFANVANGILLEGFLEARP